MKKPTFSAKLSREEIHEQIDRAVRMKTEEGDAIALSLMALPAFSVNYQEENLKDTSLMNACREGRLAVVKVLCEMKADPNLANKYGLTVLRHAS